MKQDSLPLEEDLLSLMATKTPLIGWRRAHHRRSKRGTNSKVSCAIVNSDNGPMEAMLKRQLPESVIKPIPVPRQFRLDLEE